MSEDRKVELLSGGNPQIPKGYGPEPVAAYIAAMAGWKRAVGERPDDLICAAVPAVEKAVKWNAPCDDRDRDLWVTSFHCFDTYAKVAFFGGTDLDPVPPVGSKHPKVRYLHIANADAIDNAQITDWMVQASRLRGERM